MAIPSTSVRLHPALFIAPVVCGFATQWVVTEIMKRKYGDSFYFPNAMEGFWLYKQVELWPILGVCAGTAVLFVGLSHAAYVTLVAFCACKVFESVYRDMKRIYLTELNLEGRVYREFFSEVLSCTNLTKLNIAWNGLSYLPHSLCNLKKLERLNLYHNDLRNFPENVCDLQSLKHLYLGKNEISTIPPEIKSLTLLETLNLRDNNLQGLPDAIYELLNLKVLQLDGNRIQRISPSIFQLKKLEHLNLNSNGLTELPSEIGLLQNLTSLYLEHNQLTSLPISLAILQKLKVLDLHNNQLAALPLELAQLPADCTIYAENNRLSAEAIVQFQEEVRRVHSIDSTKGPVLRASVYRERNTSLTLPSSDLKKTIEWWVSQYKKSFNITHLPDPNLTALCSDQRSYNLHEFLQRLTSTRDFTKSDQSKKRLFLKTYSLIKNASENEKYRDLMFNVLVTALTNCDDRVTVFLDKLDLDWQISQGGNDPITLARLLISARRLYLIEEQAKSRAQQLRMGDELEVVLYYQLQLKDVLRLPISAESMLFEGVGQVDKRFLEEDSKIVLSQTSEDKDIISILLSYDAWMAAMREVYKKQFDDINEAISGQISNVEGSEYENYKKISLLYEEQKNKTQELLKQLTADWMSQNSSEVLK